MPAEWSPLVAQSAPGCFPPAVQLLGGLIAPPLLGIRRIVVGHLALLPWWRSTDGANFLAELSTWLVLSVTVLSA